MADDWSYPHAGVYGDRVIKTPAFDRVAREGMLFSHAFSAAPSCTPSRAAILTGQYPHRLEEGSQLWGYLPKKFAVYPDQLEAAGYQVGLTRKGWGPGSETGGGFTRNPAGPRFASFAAFWAKRDPTKPFCFWLGSSDPHRPYEKGTGIKSGMNPRDVVVPPLWPDTPEVRSDILDYYFAVQRFDSDVAQALKLLEAAGELDNTIVVVTGDNGWPFPRAKANLYDAGTRQPLAIRWPRTVKAGSVSDAFVNLMDLAPTFLEAAGLKPSKDMTGASLLAILRGDPGAESRDRVFLERERHANVREGGVGYPMRAVRTRDYLYIRNFHPERWPAGDPASGARQYGDVDPGPTKDVIIALGHAPVGGLDLFALSFDRRPAEELYDVRQDPNNLHNLAADPKFAAVKTGLQKALSDWMETTGDPRANSDDGRFDRYPYVHGNN
jgi:N-sulfoglucosamine sulfohydrolase